MAYLALARKYRPQTFAELVGQDSTATSLANAIRMNREMHAVIFSGVRGVGKTTTARLYAKALNCLSGPTPEPCGVCESCKAIEFGSHEDVLEMDGASHTGVDDARRLIETVHYQTLRSPFRVIIIDEVHMLSQSAFNALLKTLEEPPEQVVFVFATTEIHRVPITILSRCQIFYLSSFSVQQTQDRLEDILRKENIEFDRTAVHEIARRGKGSMRDALTILDQIIVFGDGKVYSQSVRDVLGGVGSEFSTRFLQNLLHRNKDELLQSISQLIQSGATLGDFVEELCVRTRDALIAKHSPARIQHELNENDAGTIEKIVEIAKSSKELELNRMFRFLVQCSKDLDGSSMDRFIFENYCLEWCISPDLLSTAEIRSMLSKTAANQTLDTNRTKPTNMQRMGASANAGQQAPLGTQIQAAPMLRNDAAGPTSSSAPQTQHQQPAQAQAEPLRPVHSSQPTPVGFPATWRDLVDLWKRSKPLQARILEEAYEVTYTKERIELRVAENSMAAAKLLQPAVQEKLRQEFKTLFDFHGLLKIHDGAATESTTATPPSKNLLNQREDEKKIQNEKRIIEAREHPLTKEVLSAFGNDIKSIELMG